MVLTHCIVLTHGFLHMLLEGRLSYIKKAMLSFVTRVWRIKDTFDSFLLCYWYWLNIFWEIFCEGSSKKVLFVTGEGWLRKLARSHKKRSKVLQWRSFMR
jgi:hypothetical protein